MIYKTIRVPFESWKYLRTVMHNQRSESGKPMSESYFERVRSDYPFDEDGYRELASGDLGGCNGSPHNAFAEGRWTSWTLDDMKQMLDDAGLPWEDGPDIERFAV